jgi:(p)ppGpp synthase/HD superfamily hydrolase
MVWKLFREGGAVRKTQVPAMISELHQLGNKVHSLAEKATDSSAAGGPASPSEGAELIRAFLNIEQRDVRAAIIKLVTSLSSLSSRTG